MQARRLKDLGHPEQTFGDLASGAHYTHLSGTLAPRAALPTFNAKGNC